MAIFFPEAVVSADGSKGMTATGSKKARAPVPPHARIAEWQRRVPCFLASHSRPSGLRGPTGAQCDESRTAIVFWRRPSVEKSGTGQSRPASSGRLATIKVVCRSGQPKSTLIIRQNWVAASEKTRGRPGLTAFGASQSISRSSQTSRDPRRFSASLEDCQLVVRLRAGS